MKSNMTKIRPAIKKPPKKPRAITVGVRFAPRVIEKIDKHCLQEKMTRSEYVRLVVQSDIL